MSASGTTDRLCAWCRAPESEHGGIGVGCEAFDPDPEPDAVAPQAALVEAAKP